MLNFNRRTKIFVSREPVDMRASYDTLFSKARGVLSEDPLSGHLFVFFVACSGVPDSVYKSNSFIG